MSRIDFERQWANRMEDGQFSEQAVISDGDAISLSVKGIFLFGSEDEVSPAPYAPPKPVDKAKLVVSRKSIPDTIDKPWKTLEGFGVTRVSTDKKYRVSEVYGYESGMLTLRLQEVNNG